MLRVSRVDSDPEAAARRGEGLVVHAPSVRPLSRSHPSAAAVAPLARVASAPATVASPVPTRSFDASSSRRDLIAVAAYYRAERRGFAPGHEVEDWAAAEREVDGIGSPG